MFGHITLKLGTMRKEKEFTVVSANGGEVILFQAKGCIGKYTPSNGQVIFTNKGEHSPHLSMYGHTVTLTDEQKATLVEAATGKASGYQSNGTYMAR